MKKLSISTSLLSKRVGMKYLICFFILFGLVLVTGCSGPTNDNSSVAQDQQTGEIPSPTEETLAPLFIPVPTTVVVTITTPPRTPVQPSVTVAQQPVTDAPNKFCGEMVTCGVLPANSKIIATPSTRCSMITNLVIRHDPRATQCFRTAYAGSTTTTWNDEYTKLLCAKGIGSPASCAKVGAVLQPLDRT